MTHFFNCAFVCLRVHSVNKSCTVVVLVEYEKESFSQDELENCWYVQASRLNDSLSGLL